MIDGYTKTVLTIIAATLLWLAARDLLEPRLAVAQAHFNEPQKVVIVGFQGDVRGAVPVKLVAIERGEWTMNAELGTPYQQRLSWQAIDVRTSPTPKR